MRGESGATRRATRAGGFGGRVPSPTRRALPVVDGCRFSASDELDFARSFPGMDLPDGTERH
ncbi:MAG: hypothetical protein NT080_01985 [Spirochaetes bacterium]|nr:hypothetical protein [Spirochaetota bacterium]